MKSILLGFLLLASVACQSQHHGSAGRGSDRSIGREMNPQTGNYERKPPYGTQSNKTPQ